LTSRTSQIAQEVANGAGLATRLAESAEVIVQAADLPGDVVSHLAATGDADRKRLFEIVAAEAEESAAVDVLNAPGNKRWRLRLVHVPGGAHSDASEAMVQINPSGAHSRVIDTAFDPNAIVCTIEERALAAAQLVELSQAQQAASRSTTAQRQTAVTFWSDVEEVLSFNAECVGDHEAVERLASLCFALSLIRRKGKGTYECVDADLALKRTVLAAGYENLLNTLAREDMLRRTIEQHVERRRAEFGEVRLQEELIRVRSEASEFVPREHVLRLKEIIDQQLPSGSTKPFSPRTKKVAVESNDNSPTWEDAGRSSNGKARHLTPRASGRIK